MMDPIEESVEDKIKEVEKKYARKEEETLLSPYQVEKLLRERERAVKKELQEEMKKEIEYLRQRCDFILQNEQVRASFMLREAHRERQEKITALQTQLECKNLAGLMYVMCSERKKSKMEIMRLTAEYTTYIRNLQDILTDAQKLILNLSRGYKTAARVDHEWRNKMKKVLFEFQSFVNDFAGGIPEANQYFFDQPKLLETSTPTKDNPEEDPCEAEEEVVVEKKEPVAEKPWWERMGDDNRPFLMYGDMAEFKAPERREVLHKVKAAKTAPKKWKEYIFNNMYVTSKCSNADEIKDEYPYHIPEDRWECPGPTGKPDMASRVSLATSRRGTRVSEDIRGNMGSILKIVCAVGQYPTHSDQTAILGARDSMEIASTTKLPRSRSEGRPKSTDHDNGKVVLQVGSRRQSLFDEETDGAQEAMKKACEIAAALKESGQEKKTEKEDEDEVSITKMNVKKTDSKEVMAHHKPDVDHRIHYEKVCPVEHCQRLKADSFIRSLPLYMRANPFTHFEQTFEEYETCTPEQLAIIRQRLADKEAHGTEKAEPPVNEWTPSVDGVAVQTSDMSIAIPQCTCRDPFNTPASSRGMVIDLADLIPVKQNLDTINQECLYDDDIEFNRFKVIGQTDSISTIKKSAVNQDRTRIQEITKILKQHPSLLEIFQGNAHCL